MRLAALLGADDPEDIAQEAFARYQQRYDGLRDRDKSVAYLRATVANLTRSRLRHLRVVRRTGVELPLVESAEVLALLSTERQRVIKALSKLTARQRQVVVLRYWLDLPQQDIARTLGIRVGTVKSTTSHALAVLAKEIGDDRD